MCLIDNYLTHVIDVIPERFSSKMVLFLLIKSQKNGRTVRLNESIQEALETWLELAKPSNPSWEGYWHQHSLDKFYEVRGGFSNILKRGFVFFFPSIYFCTILEEKTLSCILVLICLSCWSTDLIKVLSVTSHWRWRPQRSYALKDCMI